MIRSLPDCRDRGRLSGLGGVRENSHMDYRTGGWRGRAQGGGSESEGGAGRGRGQGRGGAGGGAGGEERGEGGGGARSGGGTEPWRGGRGAAGRGPHGGCERGGGGGGGGGGLGRGGAGRGGGGPARVALRRAPPRGAGEKRGGRACTSPGTRPRRWTPPATRTPPTTPTGNWGCSSATAAWCLGPSKSKSPGYSPVGDLPGRPRAPAAIVTSFVAPVGARSHPLSSGCGVVRAFSLAASRVSGPTPVLLLRGVPEEAIAVDGVPGAPPGAGAGEVTSSFRRPRWPGRCVRSVLPRR